MVGSGRGKKRKKKSTRKRRPSMTPDQMGLTAIFRAFHPKSIEYTFFPGAHGTFSRTDHMLGHKTSLNKFKKTDFLSSIFSDHNGMSSLSGAA